jgi:hypothetical protein
MHEQSASSLPSRLEACAGGQRIRIRFVCYPHMNSGRTVSPAVPPQERGEVPLRTALQCDASWHSIQTPVSQLRVRGQGPRPDTVSMWIRLYEGLHSEEE